MKEQMNGKVFISCQSRHFSSVFNMIKVLFHIFTSNWSVSNYVSRQGKGMNKKNEITISNV